MAEAAGQPHPPDDSDDPGDLDDVFGRVRAVFSWSYTTLPPPAARLFRLLGLHPGPDTTAPAAASLAALPLAQARRLLAELVRAGLLGESVPGRYGFHDLLAAYATHLAHTEDSDDEREAAAVRLLDHYTHTAHTADRHLNPARDPIPVPLTHQSPAPPPNNPAATTPRWAGWTPSGRCCWQHNSAPPAPAGILTPGSWPGHCAAPAGTLARAGRRLAGRPACRRPAAPPCRRVHPPQSRPGGDHAGRPRAGPRPPEPGNVGWDYALLSDHTAALTYCQQALTLFQQIGDRDGQAQTWDSLGYAHHHLGHHANAADCYIHAFTLYRDLGDRYYEATVLTHLGETHHTAGHPEAARDAWTTALTILTDLHHPDADTIHTKLATLDHPPTTQPDPDPV